MPTAASSCADLSAGCLLCAVRATCGNPWSLAERSVAQSYQPEPVGVGRTKCCAGIRSRDIGSSTPVQEVDPGSKSHLREGYTLDQGRNAKSSNAKFLPNGMRAIMPTDLSLASERKRKAAQLQAETDTVILLSFVIIGFVVLLFLILH